MSVVIETQMLIRKPVAEVFNAFIDPEITSKFWFTSSLEKFSFGKTIIVQPYNNPKFVGRKVIRRMRSRMNENNYHLIINNCEHLCTWAITGVESSPQVMRMMNRLTTIGYVSSIMSYMNSMLLTITTTCFALVLYIKKKLRDKAKKRMSHYLLLKGQDQKNQ